MWNQWNIIASSLPKITVGVFSVGVHLPTSNQTPYLPKSCRSSIVILSKAGMAPLPSLKSLPSFASLVSPSFFSSLASTCGTLASFNRLKKICHISIKFDFILDCKNLIMASTIHVCISGSIDHVGDKHLCTMWSPPLRLLCLLLWHCSQYLIGWLPL